MSPNRWGFLELQFKSADPVSVITTLLDAGIHISSYAQPDDITATIITTPNQRKAAAAVLEEKGIDYRILKKRGFIFRLQAFSRRPVLLFGVFIFLLMTIVLPNRILFISIEGNEAVSTEEILLASEKMGLYFGSPGKSVRSEKIKNYLLEEIPQLQWAGVNTKGCVATVSVKERSQHSSSDNGLQGNGMIALRDGVIREMTVHSGTPLCSIGQTIRKGQLLVSGYEDCGICIRARNVEAEVFADTIRDITVKMPSSLDTRIEKTVESKKISLIFSKKRINLFKETGISDTSCGKMYKQYYINLPGGFVLPFSVITYTETFYETETDLLTDADAETMLSDMADRFLFTQMLSGSIRYKSYKIDATDGAFIYKGIYSCYEMIGQLRNEEKYIEYEYTNRENR